ncbi:hypothetical protein [Frigidibacter oleivorans]|uniref:hypothetical protein n=1 Tax=Frigidibacter oleivorans TaxID=2487129 RepID=UPI000F8F410D|nr:hypothetical protein [Frigidibacter oleivorans]
MPLLPLPPSPLMPLLLVALAAGCVQQPAACRGTAARDLQTLDGLIADSRATLDRGYAIGPAGRSGNASVNVCLGSGSDNVGISFCTGDGGYRRSGPVAVDLDAERARLKQMEAQRVAAAARAQEEAIACASAQGAVGTAGR